MWGTAGQLKEVEVKSSGTVKAASWNPSTNTGLQGPAEQLETGADWSVKQWGPDQLSFVCIPDQALRPESPSHRTVSLEEFAAAEA